MKKAAVLLTLILSGSLAACSPASESDEIDDSTHRKTNHTEQSDTDATGSDQSNEENISSENEGSQSDGTQDAEQRDETASDKDNNDSSDQESTENDSVDKEQKQMAIDTLNELVDAGKKGEVYQLNDGFYVGKTTQTDIYNTIGRPQRQDTFDRYTGSMGRASYDLRYNKSGVLMEARYLGTNVERQTNLGGITTNDLIEQLGDPDEQHKLNETNQTSYIYKLGKFEMEFVMDEKHKADHVNLVLAP
ncbi:DUF4309 domain-containing protein [Sporosarcina aquimarina]|uniref:DUF4309 domain-containing protein n=1 Tax=Sporosarcina aquimarina TaxID=114975 RepID=A0ABU4G2U4_9BACL|nr:DUF4309 domain-containing protein [Sporosarcina aquimarina]MDW0111288.1 DUF4309 domain-containing protein [Sporosarcina aquimarina]